MAQSTWKTYGIAVKHFTQFLQRAGMPCSLPVPSLHIAFFVSSLFDQGYAPSTMATHLSAIACVHKLNGFPDPTSTFLIQKAMQGARKSRGKADTRLPITFDILCKLVDALTLAGVSAWDQVMYRSMFFLAFFALARIGELCISAKNVDNVLTISSLVQIKGSDNLRVIFTNYKHSSHPVGVTVAAQASSYCPVGALKHYLALRGTTPGFLFLKQDMTPVERREFTDKLSLCLKCCHLSSTLYKSHSFRIGAATCAALKGMSDSQIRELGRWKSDAFKKYIRCNILQ